MNVADSFSRVWAMYIFHAYLKWVFMANVFVSSAVYYPCHKCPWPSTMHASHPNATERHKNSAPMEAFSEDHDSNTETSTAITATPIIPAPILLPELSINPQHVALYVTLFHFAATSNTLPLPTL